MPLRGWSIAKLSDVATWGSGGTPKATEPAYYGGNIPWAVIGDLNDGEVKHCAGAITDAGLADSSAKIVPKGTILIAMYGSIGKLGIAGMEMATNQAIAFAKPHEDVVVPKFLFWYLRSQRAALTRSGKGATQQNISQTVLKGWPIPLPPIEEQRRIVATIEEQFSRLDAASGALDNVARLSRALEERRYALLLEGGYRCVPLASIAQTSSGGTPSRKNSAYYGGSIPWIKSGELGDGVVLATEETITQSALEASSAKPLPRGTLLMAMYGATIGKLGVIGMDVAATNQAVCAIRPFDPDLTSWLWLCLRAMRSRIIAFGKGGAQPNISQSIIKDLMIPLPRVEDRQRITRAIERDLEHMGRFLATVKGQSARTQSLRSALLQQALGIGAA